jgi:hypothetical protein
MAEVGSIKATAATRWPVPRRNDNGFTLRHTNHAPDRLRPRLLFHQEEFATGKFDFGLTQTADDLKRKDDCPIQILVKRVVIACAIAEQQRRRPLLAGGMTHTKEFRKVIRIVGGDPELFHPLAGKRREIVVQRGPQAIHQRWERVAKILILAPSEPEASHIDTGTEVAAILIKTPELLTLYPGKKVAKALVAVVPEIVERTNHIPIMSHHAG